MSEKTIYDPNTGEELPSLATIKYWMGFIENQVEADVEMLMPPQAEEARRSFKACMALAEQAHLQLQVEKRG